MRVVYLGTSAFAAAVLRRLAESAHRPVLVVTPPDRRQGRGRRVSPVPAATAAEELGIEVLRTEATERPEALEAIGAAEPELGVVCAFGQLLREPLLSELELLNVHPSLLPRWRGAAPIERALMAGDHETGVAVMRVTAGLDSGPVALVEHAPIEPDDDFGTLSSAAGAPRRGPARAGARPARSRRARAHRAGRRREHLRREDGAGERRLDPAEPAIELERRVRALHPHIGAYLELDGGERLGVASARAEEGELETGVARRGRRPAARVRRGRLAAARGAPGGRAADGRGRLPARPQPPRLA